MAPDRSTENCARGVLPAYVAVVVLVGTAAAVMGQDSPQDYPQWRGQNRDGAASAFSKPASWPDHLRLSGESKSERVTRRRIVVGKTVYAFTRLDGKEGMTALDADTGRTVWRTDYPVSYEMYEGTVDHGEGPKATPLFHNGKLYTLGISGTISSFDAFSGKLVWQKPAPSIQPAFGTASSPIGDRDLVIVQADGYNALTAFEANTGRIKWTVKNEFTYASPIIVDLNGTRQVIAMTQQSILGISVAEGTVLWEHPWKSPFVQAITPVLYRQTLIVSGHNRGVMALKPIKREDKWAGGCRLGHPGSLHVLEQPGGHRRHAVRFVPSEQRPVLRYRCVDWPGPVARPAAAVNEHGSCQGGRSAFLLERRRRVDRRQEQPDRFRALQALQCRRQRDLGPAGDIGKTDLHQRCVIACVVEPGLSCQCAECADDDKLELPCLSS